MLKVILTVGIPSSGKSTWSKEEVRKDPEGTVRINRDDLRNMMSNYHFSDANEKMVSSAKDFLLEHSLKKGRNVIIDETNLNPRNFDEVCDVVRKLNIDCLVMEKSFYIELDEAIARDASRTGTAKVGEEVVRKFWKKSGGYQHKYYKPRVETILRKTEDFVEPPAFDPMKKECIICDLDGTISLFNSIDKNGQVVIKNKGAHARSPYDASNCDQDTLSEEVAMVVEMFADAGYKIVFCSGREDCYREATEKFLKKHLVIDYQLFMRKSGDQRKDSIVKEEIYKEHIASNYNVFLILDDREQVIKFWRSKGLKCFQVAEGNF